ncbi:hypothetical protein ACIA8I_19575 [Streptomyces rishiriensis]|uniref:hypothetical protein n=1 Tax=Streptomyces rishiriensis TaxID=68264 RepID=UPI003798CB4B
MNRPDAPQRLGALTDAQAEAELAQSAGADLAQLDAAGPHPARRAPGRLAHPPSLATRTRPGRPAPVPPAPAFDGPPGLTAPTAEDGDAS